MDCQGVYTDARFIRVALHPSRTIVNPLELQMGHLTNSVDENQDANGVLVRHFQFVADPIKI